jgi:hypothetical protein
MKTHKEGIERSHRFCNFKQGIKENKQGNAMMKQGDSDGMISFFVLREQYYGYTWGRNVWVG